VALADATALTGQPESGFPDNVRNGRKSQWFFVQRLKCLVPFYYQTWWFKTAGGFTLAALLALVVRRRTREVRRVQRLKQINALNEQRKQIARDILSAERELWIRFFPWHKSKRACSVWPHWAELSSVKLSR